MVSTGPSRPTAGPGLDDRGATTAFTDQDWELVEKLLKIDWSPEQIAGRLKLIDRLQISHETIYLHVWAKRRGGTLYEHLRGATKLRRKRHGTYDSRGRLAGKRPIEDRPASADNRSRVGHWEADTMLGDGKPCVVTLVERKTGYVQIGKLNARTTQQLSRRTIQLIQRQPRPVRTVTVDNGTEFHGYADIERHRGPLLLRHASSRLGTRPQREHQRTHPTIPPQATEHGRNHSI